MDELERLVDAYSMRTSASVASKLAVLMDLEQIRDPRVVPFLLKVLGDSHETEDVRIYVLKQLRSGGGLLVPADRQPVAESIADVLATSSSEYLRLQASLALGEFTRIDGMLSRLGALSAWRRTSRSTSATPRSPRSNEPDRRPNASRCCGGCRPTRHSGAPPAASCRPGTSTNRFPDQQGNS